MLIVSITDYLSYGPLAGGTQQRPDLVLANTLGGTSLGHSHHAAQIQR